MSNLNLRGKKNEIREFAFMLYPYWVKYVESDEYKETLRMYDRVTLKVKGDIEKYRERTKNRSLEIKARIQEEILKERK